jgi:hypothetical protein
VGWWWPCSYKSASNENENSSEVPSQRMPALMLIQTAGNSELTPTIDYHNWVLNIKPTFRSFLNQKPGFQSWELSYLLPLTLMSCLCKQYFFSISRVCVWRWLISCNFLSGLLQILFCLNFPVLILIHHPQWYLSDYFVSHTQSCYFLTKNPPVN